MKQIRLIIFLAAFFISCSDENKRLDPTGKDLDWFAIADSNDPIEHLRYEIYRDYDISVYYTDTIARQFRGIDGYGDSIIHYERLNPEYVITAINNTFIYSLTRNRNDIHSGVLFFKNQVIPLLLPELFPRSVLLVEELILNSNQTEAQGRRASPVFQGARTLLISQMRDIGTMSAEALKKQAIEVVAPAWYGHIVSGYATDLERFYDVSTNVIAWPAETTNRNIYYILVSSGVALTYKPHWYELGFLISSANMPGQLSGGPEVYARYYTPNREEDAISYISAVMNYNESQFQAIYGDKTGYDHMLSKYRVMKELMDRVREAGR